MSDTERADKTLKGIEGKRLTYRRTNEAANAQAKSDPIFCGTAPVNGILPETSGEDSMRMLDSWEDFYFASQILLFGVVAIGAVLSFRQLRMLAKQAKATFLLELDRRWESNEMVPVREAISEHRSFIERKIRTDHSDLTDDQKREKYKELFADELDALEKSNFERYSKFLRAWGFLETLGYLVKNKYLKPEEVDSLLGYSILQVDDMSRAHILKRDAEEESKTGRPAHLYANALYLADCISTYVANRWGDPLKSPSRVKRSWARLKACLIGAC